MKVKCYPLSIAVILAIACDCIRRGDLDGAAASLRRAAELARGEEGFTPRAAASPDRRVG
jgi:hypothetical protein